MKTNNFDEIPNTRELWVKVDHYTFKIHFKEGKWYEFLQDDDDKEQGDVFIECGENMETPYLSIALDAMHVYARVVGEVEITFAERIITFGRNPDWKDNITVQTGREEKGELDGKEEYFYNIDPLTIDRKKWLEISKLFELASHLYLNFEDFSKELKRRRGEE